MHNLIPTRLRAVLTSFLVLSLILQAVAQKKTAEAKTNAGFDRSRYLIPYKKFVLSNGLTLIVNTDQSTPVVAVNIWYHVGSRNELSGKTGYAHLFEHFFFNGSEHYPHGFREAMDNVGANNRNGTTNNDRTNFFEEVPVSALERTLYLEADRMGFLKLSKEMLERERGVVKNEKRQGENQPYVKAFNEIVESIYPKGHPYSWSTIGSMEDLNAASMDDINNWYHKYYGPNNAVLVLTGDISPEKGYELVNKYFGGIPSVPPAPVSGCRMPVLNTNIRENKYDRVSQIMLSRMYHVPCWKDRDLDALNLLVNILSGSSSARLDRKLLYETSLASSVDVYTTEQELGSLFNINVLINSDADPAVVERVMDSVIQNLIKNGPTDAEMARAKSRIRSEFSRNLEKLSGFGGRSDVLAESMTYGGSPEFYLDKLENTENATPLQVQQAAQRWLGAFHATMIVKPYPDYKISTDSINRNILPDLTTAPDVKFPAVRTYTLKNGLQVILLERKTVPIVNMTMATDAGISSDPLSKAGISSMTLEQMTKGTKTLNVFALSDQLDLIGAKIESSNSLDLSLLTLKALPDHLSASINLLSDVVLHPSFPEDQFQIEKQQTLENIAQEKTRAQDQAFRILPALLYGPESPYGMPRSGSGFEQSVRLLTRNDLVAWHAAWFKPGSSTLIVTGNVSMEELIPLVEKNFGNWPAGKAPAKKDLVQDKTTGGKVYMIDKPDAPQSVIIAAQLSMVGVQSDETALESVLTNFGGMATSRLNRNLRLDKHWSYGTSGSLFQARQQRPFVIYAPVQTDKTKESMIEIKNEIQGLAGTRPVEGEEYAAIMRNMTLRMPARFSTLKALEGAGIKMINYNLPNDYWAGYPASVRSLSAADLNAAAKKYIHPDEMIWLVVGDRSKIENGVRELGFGEIIFLNADGKVIGK